MDQLNFKGRLCVDIYIYIYIRTSIDCKQLEPPHGHMDRFGGWFFQLRPPWKHLLQICDYPLRPAKANYGQTSSLEVFKGVEDFSKAGRFRIRDNPHGQVSPWFSVDDFAVENQGVSMKRITLGRFIHVDADAGDIINPTERWEARNKDGGEDMVQLAAFHAMCFFFDDLPSKIGRSQTWLVTISYDVQQKGFGI